MEQVTVVITNLTYKPPIHLKKIVTIADQGEQCRVFHNLFNRLRFHVKPKKIGVFTPKPLAHPGKSSIITTIEAKHTPKGKRNG